MAFNPTKEQALAINANGNILVSAAAGSGKTAVLVERVISKLCSKTNPISADKLLIVTFTNAAAGEMKTRIEKRLDEECRKNPDDVSLIITKHQLSSAKICTIDSFCIDLVRENFDKLDISPDFKMSDAASLKSIDEKVVFEIINRYLQEDNQIFLQLLDIIGAEYDENHFSEFLLELYNYSRQLPFPKKWFESLSLIYNGGIFKNTSVWWQSAFTEAENLINDTLEALNQAIELLSVDPKALDVYLNVFNNSKEQFDLLKSACLTKDWDTLYTAINNFKCDNIPIVRGMNGVFEISAAKDIYKFSTVKVIDNLRKIFYADTTFINSQFKFINEPICLLSNILIELDKKLFEEYKSQNVFTFHNTEHLALKLLLAASDTDENNELLERFDEVLVDEYQDINDLQDMLFYVLSGKGKRLFVVGDVKQSIYGFRGANPNNFLSKKDSYIPISESNQDLPQKIILGNNFRCKKESCEFINYFFKLFMNLNTGKITYNDEEKLIPASVFPEVEANASEFHLIETKGSDLSATILEARHIANYIHQTMNDDAVIKVDEKTLRKSKYSDFTILLRSANIKAPIIAQELIRQGIPVNYNSEKYYESVEIKTFLSLLSVIDNPDSDIDLLTVMMSPIFSFTADELAILRAKKRDGSLYSSVIFASQNNNLKAISFLESIKNYRLYQISNSLPKFITILLYETGYLDIVTAMNDGEKRKNNLLLLPVYAQQYIEIASFELSGFVKYIIKQSGKGIKSATTTSGDDTVKIMSIHASKGLQFPICIIADTASDFNDNEAHNAVLYSTDLGIGFKYYDELSKEKTTTIGREIILNHYRSIRLEEELRLFYVAMTRTQDRLLFCGSISNIDKKINNIKTMLISSDCKINGYLFSRTKSYCDWLLISLMIHPDGKALRGIGSSIIVSEDNSRIGLKFFNYENITNYNIEENKNFPNKSNYQLFEGIENNLSYQYPYNSLMDIEAKASVSKLAKSAESEKYSFSYLPNFLSEKGITAAQRGTAMHKVMQFFNFEKFNEPEIELERLYEWQFISEKEYNSIDISALKKFFKSNIFNRIKKSSRIKKEMRFLTKIPISSISTDLEKDLKDEKIIVQGAVDLCFLEEDGLVILDFKTDKVDNTKQLQNTYSKQLNIYALACEKIFELPVKQKIIYSFALSEEIEV